MTDLDDISMDSDGDISMDSDNDSIDSYDMIRSALLANACEWCMYNQQGGVCNGRGFECKDLASYNEAKTCSRLTYLCEGVINLPASSASLQARIVDFVKICHQSEIDN